MKPVDQTTFGCPGGNCFSACIASLLGEPIESVPYFMGEPDEPGHIWAERLDDWLRPRGLYALHFLVDESRPDLVWPTGFYIRVGQSPRGAHATVGRGPCTTHDPHPSRVGLTSVEGFVLVLPIDLEAPRS